MLGKPYERVPCDAVLFRPAFHRTSTCRQASPMRAPMVLNPTSIQEG